MLSVHIVHDDDGRILALADAAEVPGPGGVVLHHQPRPRPGQHALLLSLSEEQQELHPVVLLREFELDSGAPSPALRRRSR
jgi:hypothetical protein